MSRRSSSRPSLSSQLPSPISRSALVLLLAAGCGGAMYDEAPMAAGPMGAFTESEPSANYASDDQGGGFAFAGMERGRAGYFEGGAEVDGRLAASKSTAAPAQEPEAKDGATGEGGERIAPKLIRTGSVSVAVEHFGPFERSLRGWLDEQGGYISDTSLSHHEGEVSYAHLTLRVPAEQFEALVSWTEERVKVESINVGTQDVTAEWVDVEARLANDRRAEARLQELLATETASLSDVLEVERELSRVRGEIERAEGQLRYLRDRVGYATLTLDVRVATPYVPGKAPTFVEEASEALSGSLALMADVARGGALLAVALSPWLGPPALLLGILFLVVRGRVRRRQVATA